MFGARGTAALGFQLGIELLGRQLRGGATALRQRRDLERSLRGVAARLDDRDDRVMNVRTIAGPDFRRDHPHVFLERRLHVVRSVVDDASRGDLKLLRHLDDDIRRADLPAGHEMLEQRRQILRRALWRASVDPCHDRVDILRPEARVVAEGSVVRIREPRRHRSSRHAVANRLRPRPGVGVRDQRHRTHFTRPMAAHAVLVQDWRDILRDGRSVLRRRRRCRQKSRGKQQEVSHTNRLP